MPMTWDQPENALRLMALGVGSALPPDQFTVAAVAPVIEAMYRSKPLKARCAAYAARFALERPLETICEMVEAMPASRSSASPPREPGATDGVGANGGAETDGMTVAAAAAGG
jgi:UDP:flavonoid glycosyltransferase YjiC (YdhE family)